MLATYSRLSKNSFKRIFERKGITCTNGDAGTASRHEFYGCLCCDDCSHKLQTSSSGGVVAHSFILMNDKFFLALAVLLRFLVYHQIAQSHQAKNLWIIKIY